MSFVLGGQDTEMNYIVDILEERGLRFMFASDSLGNRVSRKGAYDTALPKPNLNQIWVECRPQDYGSSEMQSLGYHLIDHHNEGDPGFNKGPNRYWEASSLGQVCKLIDHEPTLKLKMIAAADHCLHHAYNDGCSPIGREQLLEFRLSHYREGMHLAKKRFKELLIEMRNNRNYEFNGTMFFDASDVRRNSFFVTDVSAYSNIPFISIRSKHGSDTKKVFIGNASKKDIDYFMEEGCHTFGKVKKVFGDPRRQFAGAYLEKDVYDEN